MTTDSERMGNIQATYERMCNALSIGMNYTIYSRDSHYDNMNRFSERRDEIKDAAPKTSEVRDLVLDDLLWLIQRVGELEREVADKDEDLDRLNEVILNR